MNDQLYADIKISIPEVWVYNGYLEPIGLDNFVFYLHDASDPRFELTFIDDVAGAAKAKWIRHRNFVLTRLE